MVHMEGLEPPPISGLDPKSSAAANYATCAFSNITTVWGHGQIKNQLNIIKKNF